MHRNSHWRCSITRAVLINFATFTGKHLCWNFFVVGDSSTSVNIAKFLRIPITQKAASDM